MHELLLALNDEYFLESLLTWSELWMWVAILAWVCGWLYGSASGIE